MEEILNKFRDENGFVRDIHGLYKELIKYIEREDAIKLLKKIVEFNKTIISEVRKANTELSKIIMSRKDEFEVIEYVSVDKTVNKRVEKSVQDDREIIFYNN